MNTIPSEAIRLANAINYVKDNCELGVDFIVWDGGAVRFESSGGGSWECELSVEDLGLLVTHRVLYQQARNYGWPGFNYTRGTNIDEKTAFACTIRCLSKLLVQ